jgi:hypothetical protein
MLKEYDRISEAFFALHNQRNQTLKYYLTIMTLGATGISLLSQLRQTIPDLRFSAILFLVLALIGIIVFNAIIGIRADMITYARTVNRIRGYFVSKRLSLKKFLVLPLDDRQPRFREPVLHYFFLEVILVGFLNSLLLVISILLFNYGSYIVNILSKPTLIDLAVLMSATAALTTMHVAAYFLTSWIRETKYRKEHGYLSVDR